MSLLTRLGLAAAHAATVLSVTAAGADSQTRTAASTVTASTIFGVNFQIKSQVDNNFCIQVASGTTEGRTITMQQCGLSDTQL